MNSNISSAFGRRLVFLIIVLDFIFSNGAKTRHLGSDTQSKLLLGLGDEILHNDADLEPAMRDLAAERIEAEPLLDSDSLQSFGLKLGINNLLSGRSGARMLTGRYPGDSAGLVQKPKFAEDSTASGRNFQLNFLHMCHRPPKSSSPAAVFPSSYSSEYQLPPKYKRILQRNNFLSINQAQVPPIGQLRRHQIELCSSSSSDRGRGDAKNDKTSEARKTALSRWLSLWPLSIRNAPGSDDDLLLVGMRQQMMDQPSRSSVEDGIERSPSKRNCEAKNKNCLIRRVAPRKTSTVDSMLMMVGIGRK